MRPLQLTKMTSTSTNTMTSPNLEEIHRLFDEAWEAVYRQSNNVHIYVQRVDCATQYLPEFNDSLAMLLDAENQVIASHIEDEEFRRGENYNDGDSSDSSSYSTYESRPRDDWDDEDYEEDDRCENCQVGCFPCGCAELSEERREAYRDAWERESLCGGI